MAGPRAHSLFHGSVSTCNKKILILERYSVVLGVCLMNSFASCFALTVGENEEYDVHGWNNWTWEMFTNLLGVPRNIIF